MTVFAKVRTPLRPQFQTTECGVAVLRILFAHFGFEPTTAEIRRVSGVSRDCVSATDIRRTARAFGFACEAMAVEPSALRTMELPLIVHLNFIHFVVLEGFERDGVRLNCPAAGRIVIGLEEFDADFTGVALAVSPTDRSPRGARENSEEAAWWRWVARASIPSLAVALRARISTRLKTLPLDVLSYRLPEVLYALAMSALGMSARIYDRLAPTAIGLLGVLAVLGWLALAAPLAAAAFAAVMLLWLAWVGVWSAWRRPVERKSAADDSLTDLVLAALGRPQSAKLADGPARTWRTMRSLAAQHQLVDIQVRAAHAILEHSPAVLLIALLGVAGTTTGEGYAVIVAAVAVAWLAAPLSRLRGVADALRRDGFQWRDVLEEPTPAQPAIAPPPPGAAVVLNDVAFAFSSSKPEVFSHIDLCIETGEQIALVGPSACGKSTLSKLIMGVYAPTQGTVSAVDGLARVDRYTTMFEGTIRDNLTLWDGRISQGDLDRAVEDAGLGPVLAERPGGLDAPVESFGLNFSGGQLQRLEIARALARNPPVLILDDAVDALDFDSERQIRAALRRRGCALILASHRAESIAACDRVFTWRDQRDPAAEAANPSRSGAALSLIAGDAVVYAEPRVGAQSEALQKALDRLAPAEPGRPGTDLAPFEWGEALRLAARERGYRLQRLRFTEASWWRADFGAVLAFSIEGVPTPVVAAGLTPAERTAAAATYREDTYAFAPIRAARRSSIADWSHRLVDQGRSEAARTLMVALLFAAGLVVIAAGLKAPLTPLRCAALAVLAACELALLAFQAITVQRFESAVRQARIDHFTALLSRLGGDVLAHLSEVVVYRGLDGSDRIGRRIVEGVGRAVPAAFTSMAGLIVLDLIGGVGALEGGVLLCGALLVLQLVGGIVSDVTAGQEANAGLASRRHLGVIIWGLTKLRLLGVADQAFERWIALDDRWRWLRNRQRAIAALVAGSQGLATALAVAWLAAIGHTTLDRALLAGIGWGVARWAIVIGALMRRLLEDRRSAGDVQALLQEAPDGGAIKLDPALAAITVRHATVRYAGCRSPALADVTVTIDPGELTVLAGPSGGGKSTLLRVILGLQRLEHGVVHVGGHPMGDVDLAAWRQRIAGVFQGDKLEDTVTVRGHLCRGDEYALHHVWAALEAVELAGEVRAMPMGLQSIIEAGSFSTGQQQRLMIAAALLRKPALMILDEATNAIPDAIQARIVARLREHGTGCVVVTHRRTLIDLADRVHVLKAGRVIYSGPPEGVPKSAALSAREEAEA